MTINQWFNLIWVTLWWAFCQKIAGAGASVESATLIGPNGHLNALTQIGQEADKITAFLAQVGVERFNEEVCEATYAHASAFRLPG
jgi:hypothetical protein